MEESFTPKQVAMALQVSESSIKRWCDRGVIKTQKTFGGHRRIQIDALMAFLEANNREILDPSVLGIAKNEAAESSFVSGVDSHVLSESDFNLRNQFEDALIRGDETECRRILIRWFATYENFAIVADNLIAPTFHRLGDLWQQGSIEIFQERRGCEICTRLVHEFRRLIAEPKLDAPLAIGGCASGDNYSLPGQLIEVVLREVGWRAVNIGTNLPLHTLALAARRERPKLIWLSISHVQDEKVFISDYKDFKASIPEHIQVVVGGRAITEGLLSAIDVSTHCQSTQELALLAHNLSQADNPRRTSA